ncbi:hypothetical protein RHMOL_Rhmol11G0173600 [Rhododendron molle]|uniref:Uncharacterized protein n=1 Tax=Rhododendron molle TaxID=49168 RepID=A0ACC0LUT7_RHOML|nr:hypothetical protein RHMOL_Rhmol11G0173600 [Rhododendron molle]
MVRPTSPPDQLFIRRRRRPRHAATFNIVIMREELQQFGGGGGGGESEDRGPRMRDGRPRGGDDHRRNSAVTGKATERISSAEWYALVSANLGLLLGLIQIMYQNRKDSPIETRPATMAVSLAALCISIFAAVALLKFKAVKMEEEEEQQTTGHFFYCCRIRDMNVLISGVFTLSCLVSVFVADRLVWIVFVSCASIVSALLVAWCFLFLPIFGRTKSGHGESGPRRV